MAGGVFQWNYYYSTSAANHFLFPNTNAGQQYLVAGAQDQNGVWAFFTASDAQAIDSKIDDGLPLSGVVIGQGNDSSGTNACWSGSGANAYNFTATTQTCALAFAAKGWGG